MVLPEKFMNSIVVVINGKLKMRPNINHINLIFVSGVIVMCQRPDIIFRILALASAH